MTRTITIPVRGPGVAGSGGVGIHGGRDPEPADRVAAVAAVEHASHEIAAAQARLEAAVRAARTVGATWAQIGEATGVTRQAAHERWGHIPRAGCPRDGCDCQDHAVVTAGCGCGHGPGRGHRRREG